MKIYNEELAKQFEEIADLLAILNENSFKIRAYHEAARFLLTTTESITSENASKETFKKWPGIGEALAEKMMEFVETGTIHHLEELRKAVPENLRNLLKIPHLGPHRIQELTLHFGGLTKEELIEKARNGEIEKLPGFGQKLVQDILEALQKGQEKKHRFKREEVEPIAKKIHKLFSSLQGFKQMEVAGSYRRKSKDVGDLDLLVCGKINETKAEELLSIEFPNLTWLGRGDTKLSFVIFPQDLQVDIRIVPKESWGAALLYFTGSKSFNIEIRKQAIKKGYLLNEYGLYEKGKKIAGKTEKEIFQKLGIPYLEPEKRI